MPNQTDTSEIFLDLRNMFPPEPMERVLDALAALAPRERIRLVIDREPHPLYRILERNGYTFHCTEPQPGVYQVVIQED